VDGLPNSLEALRYAAGQAYQRGVGIEIVHVIPAGSEPAAVSAGYAAIAMAVRCAAPRGLRVASDWVVDLGDPGDVLARRSDGAELLVIGGRFPSAQGNLLDGEVVSYCLDHARCGITICADMRVYAREAKRPADVGAGQGDRDASSSGRPAVRRTWQPQDWPGHRDDKFRRLAALHH
jgi:nucleotide-binding universal stress UspA family protein